MIAYYTEARCRQGIGGPEEDHQLHHCCWTGRVSEREEEDKIFEILLVETALH